MSCIERKLNTFVLVFLALLISLTLASFGGALGSDYVYTKSWFLFGRETSFYFVSKINFLIVFNLDLY
jgi:hypothetical protein